MPNDFKLSAIAATALLASQSATAVTIEDTSALTLTQTWTFVSDTSSRPSLGSVTYNPFDGFAYLGIRSGAVTRLNPNGTQTSIGVASGGDVGGIAADPVTGDLFATNDYEGYVTRFDASNGFAATRVLSNISPNEDDTAGVVILPTTYTGSLASPGAGLLTDRNNAGDDYLFSFLNPATPNLPHTATIVAQSSTQPSTNPVGVPTPNGSQSTWSTLTASNSDVFLADEGQDSSNDVGQIYRVDDATTFVPLLDDASPIDRPRGIATPLAGDVLYVADNGTNSGEGKIYAVDPTTGDQTLLVSNLDFPFWGSLAVDPAGTRLWVVDEFTVTEFAIVPEPATGSLLLLSLMAASRRRRR